jgi:hypothetical protein
MRVAICMSGLTRSLQYTWPMAYFNVMKHLDNVDVFVHTWDNDNGGTRGFEMKSCVYDDKQNYIEKFMQPKSYEIESQEEFTRKNAIRRSTYMYYSIFKANLLKKQYEDLHNFKYDVVIRSRMDAIYEAPLLSEELRKCIEENVLYVGTFNDPETWPHAGLYPDSFAFSNSKNMDTYSDVHLQEIAGLGGAEPLLTSHLNSTGMKVEWSLARMKHTIVYNNNEFKAWRNQ